MYRSPNSTATEGDCTLNIWNSVSSSDNEATIRDKISSWLASSNIDYALEHPTPAGPADVHLLHRHCIIEVKTSKKLKNGPWEPGTGSRRKESAYEQLGRYIDTAYTQTELLNDSLLPWRGAVTDGNRWWIWEWPQIGHKPLRPQIYGMWDGRKLTVDNSVDLALVLKRDAAGKPWPPSNPAKLKILFDDSLDRLNRSYRLNKNMDNTKIQKYLWLDQLKASGHHPDSHDEDDLFVKHTLLILTSRFISGLPVPTADEGLSSPLLEGFVGWASNALDDLKRLQDLINEYNWRGNQTDVMRSLYMTIIPKNQRKLYGEYYTPDWLAEKICEEVIDEKYIEDQINRFLGGNDVNGILDPACGSGTFLYSAVKHLLKSTAVKNSGMDRERQIDFICHMIHGIDILPVAVEMAVANITRILGGVSPSRLQIHQGDALLASRTMSTVHGTMGDGMTLYAANVPIKFPYGFLERANDISLFVTSAREGRNMPTILEKNLDKDSRDILRTAHDDLSDIIKRFGNGVWAWYIKNQAAPLLLSKGPSIARIITNPPWLRKNHIRDKRRQESIEKLSKDMGVHQGGKMATALDLACVFVASADNLYMDPNGKSGWVLPNTAIYGSDQWERLRNKLGDRLSEMWDLGSLPFPAQMPSCVILVGTGKSRKIRKATLRDKKRRPLQYDAWNESASHMIRFDDADLTQILSPEKRIASEWVAHGVSVIRQGATLVPHVLVRVDPNSIKIRGGGMANTDEFCLRQSHHARLNGKAWVG